MDVYFKYLVEKKIDGIWHEVDTAYSDKEGSLVWLGQMLRAKYLPDFSYHHIPMQACEKFPCFEPSANFEMSEGGRKMIREEWYDGNIYYTTLNDIVEWLKEKDFNGYYFIGYLYFINYCFKNMEIICHDELGEDSNNIRILYWLI